jgi:hypothetical protein
MAPEIPSAPDEFFTRFFPQQYEASARCPREDTAARATFEGLGVGAWSFSVSGRALRAEAGRHADTALQVAVTAKDFDELFVERTRRKVAESGRVPNELLDALLPLFIDGRKLKLSSAVRGTLRVELRERGRAHALLLTPGADVASEPRAVVRLRLDDFFALVGRKVGVTKLLITGRLKVSGDKAHALKLAGFIG